jgi:hypothetical protein
MMQGPFEQEAEELRNPGISILFALHSTGDFVKKP